MRANSSAKINHQTIGYSYIQIDSLSNRTMSLKKTQEKPQNVTGPQSNLHSNFCIEPSRLAHRFLTVVSDC
jgi:hypothetical protein